MATRKPAERSDGPTSADLPQRVDAALAAFWAGDASALDPLVDEGPLGPLLAGALRSGATAAQLPEAIGPFRVLSELGRGGMGVVYAAEQDAPRRRVALKVVRGGATADEVHLRLFQREVQTLAQLNHPAIASLYEAGVAQPDLHYFAMELVEGLTLAGQFDGRPTDRAQLDQRLRVFVEIADAIHYAHQRGIIHRDLKPSNILLDRSGRPRVLDFGLARLVGSDLQATTILTEPGQIAGTLPYMSPEQAIGDLEQIDTRSDVYALGVILFQLITGALPYALRGKPMHEMVRTICEQPAKRPSIIEPRARGDLDTIVLTALEKEPVRRYDSASRLADDVRRLLDGYPITARPPGTFYQIRKLVGRHRIPFALAAILLLVINGAAVFASLQAWTISQQKTQMRKDRDAALDAQQLATKRTAEAERESRKSTALVRFFQQMLAQADPAMSRGGDPTVREILDLSAQELDAKFPDEPDVRAALHETIANTYSALGAFDEAADHIASAVALRNASEGEQSVPAANARVMQAGILAAQGLHDHAEPIARDAATLLTALVGTDHVHTHAANIELAAILRATGRWPEAEQLLRDVLAAQQTTDTDPARTLQALGELATLLWKDHRLDEAERLAQQCYEGRSALLGPRHPRTLSSANTYALVLRSRNKLAEAEEIQRTVLTARIELLGNDHPHTLTTQSNLAVILEKQGRHDESRALQSEVLAARETVLGLEHPDTQIAMVNLAMLLTKMNQLDKAEPLARRALALAEAHLGTTHPRTIQARRGVLNALLAMKRYDEALPLAETHHRILADTRGDDHETALRSMLDVARILGKLGEHERAEAAYRDAIQTADRATGPINRQSGVLRGYFGTFLRQTGRLREAEAVFLEAADCFDQLDDRTRRDGCYRTLVRIAEGLNDDERRAEYARRLAPQ